MTQPVLCGHLEERKVVLLRGRKEALVRSVPHTAGEAEKRMQNKWEEKTQN